MKPIVSIILPTYNGKSEWLSKSIDSVLSQTFKDFELIIINDASTNNIEDTILRYKNQDSRIAYVNNEKNLKLTKTLNKGIKLSRGKYIARIDDDDIRTSNDKLEKQVSFMEENMDYGLCGAGSIILINEKGDEIGKIKLKTEDKEIKNIILRVNYFVHSSVIIRKSILDDVGYYSTEYNNVEDYELWCRIGTKSKFQNLDNISIKYRINSKGISVNNNIRQKKLALKVCLKNKNNYPNFLKALIYRVMIDFILPESVTRFLAKQKINLLKIFKSKS